MIKRLIIACSALCLFLWWAAFADYDSFVNSLSSIQMDAQQIVSSPTVSRYDVARLLNFIDCHDCKRPSNQIVNRLTPTRWTNFRANLGVNFDDIAHSSSLAPSNNYYCVAYVAEQSYMSWYPRQTSPLCSGKFCGTNNTTVADFIQVIINILADRIASHYQVNRQSVQQRLDNSSQSQLAQKYLTIGEQWIIRREAAACTTGACALKSAEEFKTYLKYCTFNLNACGMQEFDTAEEQFWPVAELNILVLENIITSQEADDINVEDYVDGETVIRSLAQVKEKVACTFNDDKDFDGIKDYNDNCYLTYNPSQRDQDADRIGDVCDDDIDGDTVKNPVGIVDDEGNINTEKMKEYEDTMDNCLFIVNTDQSDFNQDTIGDACSESEYYGMTIVSRKIRNATYALAAQYTGALRNFAWDFGDGSYGQGRAVSHTFPWPGTYEVILTALGWNKTYIATTTIVVVPDVQAAIGFQILPNPLTANVPATIAVTPVTTRPVWSITWQSNNQNKQWSNGQVMSFLYNNQWSYPIVAQAYDGNQIVAYAQGSVSINGDISSYLKSSNLAPNVGQPLTFTTTTAGIQNKDIVSVKRDFGDWTIQTNSSLNYNYTYTIAGPKIVTQTIYLLDGTILTNVININVVQTQNVQDEWVDLIPAKLVMRTGEPINYRFVLNGIDRADISRILVDMGDGQSLLFNNAIEDNGFDYTYIIPGIRRIMARVEKTDGKLFYPAAHITVIGVPMCLQQWPVAWACDMDKDTIPDMCDDDIDGDGITNVLGLILQQHPPLCKYSKDDLDQDKIKETIDRIKKWDDLDNCSITVNPNQADLNGNFIGDSCEDIIAVDPDRDGDGIPDSKDLCPDTPENMNGIEDVDGCPEFTDVPDVNPGVTPQCNVCPCPYVQNAADLVQWDKVRAVLMNSGGTVRINTSPIEIIE